MSEEREQSLGVSRASAGPDHPLSPGLRDEGTSYFTLNQSAATVDAVTTPIRDEKASRPALTEIETARLVPRVPSGSESRPSLFAGLSDGAEDQHKSDGVLLSLRCPPHKLGKGELEQGLLALREDYPRSNRASSSRSRSSSFSAVGLVDGLPVELVASIITTLSADLERSQSDLAKSHRVRAAQIEALRDIIRNDAIGVSDGTVERALLRATATVEESPAQHRASARWELHTKGREGIANPEIEAPVAIPADDDLESLHHDLEEAMSETNVVLHAPSEQNDPERASVASHEQLKPRHMSISARLFAGLGATRPESPTPARKIREAAMATPSPRQGSASIHGKRARSGSVASLANSTRSSIQERDTTSHRASPNAGSTWSSAFWGWGTKKGQTLSHPTLADPSSEEEEATEETLHPRGMTRSSSVSSAASTTQRTAPSSVATTTGTAVESPDRNHFSADQASADPIKPHAAVDAVLSKRHIDAAAVVSAYALPLSHPPTALSSAMTKSFSAGSITGSLPMTHPPHFTAVARASQKWVASGAKSDLDEGLLRKPRVISPAIRSGAVQLLGSLSSQHPDEPNAEAEDDDGGERPDRLLSTTKMLRSSSNVSETSQKSSKHAGYLETAKGQLGKALGLGSDAIQRPRARRSEPSLTLPALIVDRQQSVFQTLPIAAAGPASTSSGQTVMEMGTIVKEDDRPPTFATHQTDLDRGEYFFDRYGFAIDMKSGMRSLRELKQRARQQAAVPDDEPLEEAVQNAMGPSPSVTPHLRDSRKFQYSTPPADTAPKSIKRLAAQVAEFNEQQEKAQRDAWDGFLKKRHSKLTSTAASKPHVSTVSALGTALAGDAFSADDDSVWSENRIGIARLGRGDKDDWRTFKTLVRSGIPITYRPAVWAEMSGAHELREPGYYQELVQKHEADTGSVCLKQIEADVGRTFGTNVFFGGAGPGIPKLRRILAAFSWHCPDIGYCQGMNMVAGTLLLTFPAEEDAFWMLTAIIERMLPSDYYTPSLLVSRADQRVLRDLCARVMPSVQALFDQHGMELEVITFGWFLSLYANVMPIQTLLRVWDILFCDGVIVLFRVALAMIRMHEDELFACDSATSMYVYLRNVPTQLVQADRLIKLACGEFRSIKTKDVMTLREKHVREIEAAA